MFTDNSFWIIFSLINLVLLSSTHVSGSLHQPEFLRYEGDSEFRKMYHDKGAGKLYAGGINVIYEFDTKDVTRPPRQLNWEPAQIDREDCMSFQGDNQVLCENNIVVVVSYNDTHLYACGTMAFAPTCTYIEKWTFTRVGRPESVTRRSPFTPYVNTVSVVARRSLFTATLGNMQGNDAIISRSLNGDNLRSQDGDKYWLNDPVFLHGYHVKNRDPAHDKVMVFFREKAEEFQPFMYGFASDPSERSVVSRVATVCVNDQGGTNWVLRRKFATYTKMSIECRTQPDEDGSVFRYTHLESTFVLENEADVTNPTVYGIFTMPNGAIAGSAVCAFTMNDIKRAMSTRQYWNRQQLEQGPKRNFTGKKEWEPGNCVPNTRSLSLTRLSFGQKHAVKFGNIYPSFESPHYQEPSVRYRFLVVDSIPSTKNSLIEDATVLYMITEKGLLKRVVHESSYPPRSLPDIQVKMADQSKVIDMFLGDNHLFVVTNRTITQIPLAACTMYLSCNQCQSARDPYCALSRGGLCESVFEKSSAEIAEIPTYEVVCPQDPPRYNPELEMVEELRRNLTDLYYQNKNSMKMLTDLTEEQRKNNIMCEHRLTQQNVTILNLTAQVVDVTKKLEDAKSSQEFANNRVSICRRQRNYVLRKAAELSAEVERRITREEFNKEVNKLRESNEDSAALLQERRRQLDNLTEQVTTCQNNLQASKRLMVSLNISCEVEKRRAIADVSETLQSMHTKMSNMHNTAIESSKIQNNTLKEADHKVQKCNEKIKSQISEIDFLRKMIKENSQKQVDSKKELAKKERLIKRLTWLHRRNGERGQQQCENNGWFLSNATGNLFLLGKRRASFEESKRICEVLNARLAVFKNDEELRYINNVIRAFEPTRHFWIGLTKHRNATLSWEGGSRLYNVRQRFGQNQMSRIRRRVQYCTELTSTQRWNLIPCARARRPICEKLAARPEGQQVISAIQEIQKFRKSG